MLQDQFLAARRFQEPRGFYNNDHRNFAANRQRGIVVDSASDEEDIWIGKWAGGATGTTTSVIETTMVTR